MTDIARGWDAADTIDPCPDRDDGFAWAEVYLGGSSAFRVTPPAEIIARCTAVGRILPVWVPTPGLDNPRQSALACVAALRAAKVPGWAHPWRAVMVDLETGTEPDQPWLAGFQAVTVQHGYDLWPYGSTGWVFGYADYSGLVVAQPDGSDDLDALRAAHPGRRIVCKQYQFAASEPGGLVDLDALDAAELVHLGPVG